MRIAIINIGSIVSGDLEHPLVAGDTIITEDGHIVSVGTAAAGAVEACDVVIDADRTTAIPGLIDSHVHITFGDYTPRQRTVGYLESYLHGGVTTSISASEVHVPGRKRLPPIPRYNSADVHDGDLHPTLIALRFRSTSSCGPMPTERSNSEYDRSPRSEPTHSEPSPRERRTSRRQSGWTVRRRAIGARRHTRTRIAHIVFANNP